MSTDKIDQLLITTLDIANPAVLSMIRQRFRLAIRGALGVLNNLEQELKKLKGKSAYRNDRLMDMVSTWVSMDVWHPPFNHAPAIRMVQERLQEMVGQALEDYEVAADRPHGLLGRKGAQPADVEKLRRALLEMFAATRVWLLDIQPEEDRPKNP